MWLFSADQVTQPAASVLGVLSARVTSALVISSAEWENCTSPQGLVRVKGYNVDKALDRGRHEAPGNPWLLVLTISQHECASTCITLNWLDVDWGVSSLRRSYSQLPFGANKVPLLLAQLYVLSSPNKSC